MDFAFLHVFTGKLYNERHIHVLIENNFIGNGGVGKRYYLQG